MMKRNEKVAEMPKIECVHCHKLNPVDVVRCVHCKRNVRR